MNQRRKKPHEKGLAIHWAPSFVLGIARCTAKRKPGNRWGGYGVRKRCNPDADALGMAEDNMDRDASASFCSVWRSRRPHSTPRNFMYENRETSKTPAVPTDSGLAGEGLGRTAGLYVFEEPDRGIVPMNPSNKDRFLSAEAEQGSCGSRRTLSHLTRTRHGAGLRVSHGWARVRTSATLGRYSSAIRAASAHERFGSVPGGRAAMVVPTATSSSLGWGFRC